jgi:hypothetical protein
MPDANSLLASLLVSSIGLVLLRYGKKMARVPQIAVGIVLLVFPYFVGSAIWILAVGACLLALLWLAVNNGW